MQVNSLLGQAACRSLPAAGLTVVMGLLASACAAPIVDPDLEEARGRYAFEQGQWAWARTYFERAYEADPDRVRVLKPLGISWLSGDGGSLERGTAVLERFLSLEPTDHATRRYLVSTLLRMGRPDDAAKWAAGLPDDPESLTLRARTLVDDDPEAAMECARRALKNDPNQLEAHRLLARLDEATGDFESAREHARRLIELDPFDPKPYGRMLRLARYHADHELVALMAEAHEIAGRLIQSRQAGRLPVLVELRLVDRLGKLVGSQSVPYRTRRAELWLKSGRVELGIRAVDALMDEHAMTVDDQLAFARRLADLGRTEYAKRIYDAVVESDPDNATARGSAAMCNLLLGRIDAARASMLDAIQSRPDWAGYHAILGRIELERGARDAAVDGLKTALHLAPWQAEWRRLLATNLRLMGRTRQADNVVVNEPRIPELVSAAPDPQPRAESAATGQANAIGGWFTDISERVGIDFTQYDGRSGERYYVETTGSGCGFVDFDDDGDLDIYLLTGAPTPGAPIPRVEPRNRLYENLGGSFVDISRAAGVDDDGFGMGMCVGDIDADGRIDVMVTNYGADRLYRNLGGGRFEEVSERAGVDDPRWGSNCAFGDIDGDGDVDLYVSHYLHFDFGDNPKCGDAARGIFAYCRPSSFRGVTDSLFINDGTGRFTEEGADRGIEQGVLEKGFGVVMTDIDSDRDLDIFVANDSTANRLYLNDGQGFFSDVGLVRGISVNAEGMTTSGMGVDVADLDGDALMDIVLTNYATEPNALYHNLGGARFADVAAERGVAELSISSVGWGVVLADIDNDGDRDMAIANGHVVDNISEFEPGHSYEQTNALLFNDDNGYFDDMTVESGWSSVQPKVSRSLAVGDWNNDGRLDLLVSNCNDRFELLENRISNDHHWLGVRLVGGSENRFAIGARVEAVAAGRRQVAEVRSGGSFQAQSDLRLHFGLGADDGPIEIRIVWPDGSEQVEVVDRVDRYVDVFRRDERAGY